MLGLRETEPNAGQEGLDLASPLTVGSELCHLPLLDAKTLPSANGLDKQGHRTPNLVDFLEGPGLAKHGDHGGQVPRLHPPDYMGIVGARRNRRPRCPEEAHDLVESRALALLNLLQNHLLRVGLWGVEGNPQGVGPGLQCKHLIGRCLFCS